MIADMDLSRGKVKCVKTPRGIEERITTYLLKSYIPK